MAVRASRCIAPLLVVITAALAGCTAQHPVGWGEVAPSRFLASANAAFSGPRGIVAVDARTGRTKPFPLRLSGLKSLAVTGMALDGSGNLWVARATGPLCTSNANGCGPKPHSCAGQIERIDHRSGTSRVVYRATDDERIDGVSPSPSADEIAFLSGQCDRSYFNQHIRVLRVGGNAFDIGTGVAVCHELGVPVWLPSGDRLAVLYEPPSSQTPEPEFGHGVCSMPAPGGVAVIAAAPALDMPSPKPLDPECQPTALASTSEGLAAILTCGTASGTPTGTAKLAVMDQGLDVRQTWPLASCSNSASVAADHADDIAVSTYEFCGMPTDQPHTVVFVVSKGVARAIADFRGGTLALDHLTW